MSFSDSVNSAATLVLAVTVKKDEPTMLDVVMDPVTFTSADEVMPADERVPVMSTGPPTTRLAVASMLDTEMVPPDRRLLTVKLEVSIFDVVRVLSEPMSKLEVTVSSVSWVMLDVVIVPVILRLDSPPGGGAMVSAVSVNPEAITRLELMVTGEAPTILDVVRVPVIHESPTT